MALRVLVVDDNVDMRESLVLVLKHLGHEARQAPDGHEALACLEGWRPHIALVDLGMPGMSGYELSDRARRLPCGATTAFVAMTGWEGDGPRDRSLAAGFVRHVVKPLTLAELRTLIDEVAVGVQSASTGSRPENPALPSADNLSPLDHAQQHDDEGDDEEHVDESAHGVRGHKSE